MSRVLLTSRAQSHGKYGQPHQTSGLVLTNPSGQHQSTRTRGKPTLAVVLDALLSHFPSSLLLHSRPFSSSYTTGTTNDVCGVPLRRPHQKRLAYSSFSGDVDHYRSSFYATFSTRGVIFVSLWLPPFLAVTAERRENCHRTSSLAARGKVTCLPAWLLVHRVLQIRRRRQQRRLDDVFSFSLLRKYRSFLDQIVRIFLPSQLRA